MSTRRITPLNTPPETDRNASDEDPTLLLPARDTKRQLWVGLFVLLGILATLFALFTLTDPATFRGRYIVSTTVPDAGGLRRGDPVQLRGVNIGRVHKFYLLDNAVKIELELEGEFDLPKDSRVALKSAGLLGGMTSVIEPGRSQEKLEDGDVLPGSSQVGTFDVATVGMRADSVLRRIQLMLNDRNIGALDRTMANMDRGTIRLNAALESTSALVAEQRTSLRALTASLNRSATGLEAATGPQLAQATNHLNRVATQMDSAVAKLDASSASLKSVMGRVDRGEGTLGKLTKDQALYDSLVATVASLKQLSDDIKANPRKYINLKVF